MRNDRYVHVVGFYSLLLRHIQTYQQCIHKFEIFKTSYILNIVLRLNSVVYKL